MSTSCADDISNNLEVVCVRDCDQEDIDDWTDCCEGYMINGTTCIEEWWEEYYIEHATTYCDHLQEYIETCETVGDGLCTNDAFGPAFLALYGDASMEGCSHDVNTMAGTVTVVDLEGASSCPGCRSGPWGDWRPWDFTEEGTICCDLGLDYFDCDSDSGFACASGADVAETEVVTESVDLPSTSAECEDLYGNDGGSVAYDASRETSGDGIDDTGCYCYGGAMSWDAPTQTCKASDAALEDVAEHISSEDDSPDVTDEPAESGGEESGTDGGTGGTEEADEAEGGVDDDFAGADADTGGEEEEVVSATFDDCIAYYGGAALISDDNIERCFEDFPDVCANSYCNSTNSVDIEFGHNNSGCPGTCDDGCCDCVEAFKCLNDVGPCLGNPTNICIGGAAPGWGFYSALEGNPCAYPEYADRYLGVANPVRDWGYTYSDAAVMAWNLLDLIDFVDWTDCTNCASNNATPLGELAVDTSGDSTIVYTCTCNAGYEPVAGGNPYTDADQCLPLFEEEYSGGGTSGWCRVMTPLDSVDGDAVYSTLPVDWVFGTWCEALLDPELPPYTTMAEATENMEIEAGSTTLVYNRILSAFGDVIAESGYVDLNYYYPVVPDGTDPLRIESTANGDGTFTLTYSEGPADIISADEPGLLMRFGGFFESQWWSGSPSLDDMTKIFTNDVEAVSEGVLAEMGSSSTAQVFTFKKISHSKLDENLFSVFDTTDIESATPQTISVSTTMTTTPTSTTTSTY